MRSNSILPGFLMNITIAVKRVFFVLLTVSGLALCALAGNSSGPCPLPVTTSETAQSDTTAAPQSPEQPACKRRVVHNGMELCLPCPAADAHERHGDASLGACSKPGNETPPGQ